MSPTAPSRDTASSRAPKFDSVDLGLSPVHFLSAAECASPEFAIAAVELKELNTFPDDRGFFREVIRFSDPFFAASNDEPPFAQWSHSKMAKNTVKAWHYHHLQIDWWYAAIGLLHVVLFDDRAESPTYLRKMEFLLGEPDLDSRAFTAVVKIPQGVLHGCRVMSDSAHLFYVTSQTYNPNDEGRHAFDSKHVPHSWGDSTDLIVAAKDRVDFVPTATRVVLA